MTCPKCSAPLQRVHLPGRVDIETCQNCCGVFYDEKELTIALAFENLTRSAYVCPKCAGAMQVATVYKGALTLEVCNGCRGIWLDPGEVQKLRYLSGRENLIAAAGTAAEPEPPPPPLMRMADSLEAVDAGGRPEPEEGSIQDRDVKDDSAIFHKGRSYAHFQTSRPMVTFVLGEFNWKVAVGDKSMARDFVSPPYLLSEEITQKESLWLHGEYLEPEEVWSAFTMEGSPPPRGGVAPAQPNPADRDWAVMFPAAVILGPALVALFLITWGLAMRRTVHVSAWDNAAYVSAPFTLAGRKASVKVELESNLENAWAFYNMALVDADTGGALNFSKELSYYSGVEDGEGWSEGSRLGEVTIPSVEPGRYVLRAEPETNYHSLQTRVRVIQDEPRLAHLFAALALLAAPLLWVAMRRASFEQKRWLESDHPWSSGSGDDDE